MLSHSPCRNMASKSKTSTGAPRCTQMVNQLRPNSQHFGRMHSLKLLPMHLTRFSPHSLTSSSNSLRKKMRKVRCRRMLYILKILWHSGNLSKSPNTQSRSSLGMTCQPQGFDGRRCFLSQCTITIDGSRKRPIPIKYHSDDWTLKW